MKTLIAVLSVFISTPPAQRNVMKKFFIALALLPMIALGGCAGFNASTVSAIELEVQNDANLVCGFIPTVATIAGFIPGAGPIAVSAASIAESICSTIAQAPRPQVQSARLRSMKLGGQAGAPVNVVTVNVPWNPQPVVITGKFTR